MLTWRFLFLPHLTLQPACNFITALGILYNLFMNIKILEASPTKKKKEGGSYLTLKFSQDGRFRITLPEVQEPAGLDGGRTQAGVKCADGAQLRQHWAEGGGRRGHSRSAPR